MAGNQQESEDQAGMLHNAWKNAQLEFGEESSECVAALEKYTAFLLALGEQPVKSEDTAKFILGKSSASSSQGQHPESVQDRLSMGAVIGDKYRIIRWIGQGGMSRVYLVEDVTLKKEMALKISHANLRNDKSTLEQFEAEAEAGRRLKHANIISVYDSGTAANGCPFLVMEYVEGLTLGQLLAKEKFLQPERALHIFSQVCDALEHAHQQKIIHNDMKPSNLILIQNAGDADYIKVADFGFAQVLNESECSESLTKKDEVFGSPHYMSPEHCQGFLRDTRSDIYSLACVMFEALNGTPPFTGSIDEVVHKQIHELPERISNVSADNLQLLNKLELIIFRCLSKEPEDRFPSMALLKAALDNLRLRKRDQSLLERLKSRFFPLC